MFAEQLLLVTRNDVVGQSVKQLIADAGLSGDEASTVYDHAMSRVTAVRDLTLAMGEAEDEVELYRTAAAYWLELRFEWQRNNDVMNYQSVLRGNADPRVVVEGAIGSFMLSRLELCLDATHLDMLARYAVELLADVHVEPRNLEGAA